MHHRRSALTVAALCAALACPIAARAEADTDDLEALLNQPVYAASKFAQDAADAPAAVTVLTAGDIRAYGWRTLADILNAVRGVYTRYDRQYTYLGVRGFDRPGDFTSRVLLLIDGQRINDNVYAQAPTGREFPLDVSLIERVEFLPGPGSALYGSNAVLAVVNVVTRSADALVGARVGFELGDASSRLTRVSLGRELGNGTSLLVSGLVERRPGRQLYTPEFDAAETNAGIEQGMDGERNEKVYAKLQSGHLTLTALLSGRRKTTPGAPYGVVFNDPTAVVHDDLALLGATWQTDPLTPHSWYLHTDIAAYDYLGAGRYEPDRPVVEATGTGRWWSLEARWTGRLFAQHVLVAGLELQRNLREDQAVVTREPVPVTDLDLRSSSHRYGVYLTDEWGVAEGLKLNIGLRADRQLDGQSAVTPRLAALWSPHRGLTLKALAGSAFREPNVYESQYRDETSAANRALQRERLASRELAMDWRHSPQLRLAGSLYRYRVDGLIEQEVDPNTGLLVFRNRGIVTARGIELEGDYTALAGWRLRGSWTCQAAEDHLGARLTNSPRSLMKLHGVTPVPGTSARVGLELQRISERLTLAGAALPAVMLANLTVQFNPVGPWNLSGSVYNLTGRRFADPSGPEFAQDTIMQDGRTWRVQLGLQL